MENQNYQNKVINDRAPMARTLEKWAGAPFQWLEYILSWVLARPWNFMLSFLDGLSYKLEGTLFKKIVGQTLLPITLILTLIIGFEIAEQGISFRSFAGFLGLLLVYGLIFAPMERLFPWSRKWLHGGNDLSVDLMFYISGILFGAVSRYLVTILPIFYLASSLETYGHQWWPSNWHPWIQVMLFVLLQDFFRYWYHRGLHEIPFLWRFHSVHHSVERLYWLNGIRAHPVEIFGQALFYAFPLALLQPGADVVMVVVFMQLSIGIFQHANIGIKLGIWEYIFSVGDNHRYHHYPNAIGDSNYGGEFIVWDILFGTFYHRKDATPSDIIGISAKPDYPLTWMGLMIAPFLPDQSVFGPRDDRSDGKSDGRNDIDR